MNAPALSPFRLFSVPRPRLRPVPATRSFFRSCAALVRPLAFSGGVLLALLVVGCQSVWATKPLGETPSKINASDWEGIWSSESLLLRIAVGDAAGGVLRVSVLEENGAPRDELYTVFLRNCCGTTFASFRPGDAADVYWWGPVAVSGDDLVVWEPDAQQFRALVKGGKLQGRIEAGGDVRLGELSVDEMHQLASGALGVPYRWDAPGVFHRIRKSPAHEK